MAALLRLLMRIPSFAQIVGQWDSLRKPPQPQDYINQEIVQALLGMAASVQQLVRYRREDCPFTSVNDLDKNIEGVGPTLAHRIVEYGKEHCPTECISGKVERQVFGDDSLESPNAGNAGEEDA